MDILTLGGVLVICLIVFSIINLASKNADKEIKDLKNKNKGK